MTTQEEQELSRLEDAWKRLDDIPPDEVDGREWRRILKRLVELREKSLEE